MMTKINYNAVVGDSYCDTGLVEYLENLGMTTDADGWYQAFEISWVQAIALIEFCINNDHWFVRDDNGITISENKGFYIEF